MKQNEQLNNSFESAEYPGYHPGVEPGIDYIYGSDQSQYMEQQDEDEATVEG